MTNLSKLKVKIFSDGADVNDMLEQLKNPLIRGFTTNPTLMRKVGISNYKRFALDSLKVINSTK